MFSQNLELTFKETPTCLVSSRPVRDSISKNKLMNKTTNILNLRNNTQGLPHIHTQMSVCTCNLSANNRKEDPRVLLTSQTS